MFPVAVLAQSQSTAVADRTATQKVLRALAQAGIDPRVTSVQVVTTSDHVVHLSGLISNAQLIKAASTAAAKAAPGYRVVNNIRSSFFDDPNHVSGGITK
jgi:osmotically-inducible protein OsmY